jgi:hypothetical protein
MYQILGEIETIHNILEKIKNPSMSTIIANIEDWKTRLGTIMTDTLQITVAYNINKKIDSIIENKNKKNIKVILVYLDDISEKLNDYVNRYVKKYFLRKKINVNKYQ